jgi:hypothetical protein
MVLSTAFRLTFGGLTGRLRLARRIGRHALL